MAPVLGFNLGLFLLMLLAPVPGLVLLIHGWRGKRLDDHPHCRKCAYDLTGQPADRTTCPECGADLTARHAVRMGLRQRRPLALGVEALLLLAAVVLVGTSGFVYFSSRSAQTILPAWVLRWEIHGGGLSAGAAMDEVSRRLRTGVVIPQASMDGIVDDALAVQADRRRQWDPKWGDLVQEARRHGLVDPKRWETYLREAIKDTLQLEVRPQVAHGDPIPYRVLFHPARAGGSGTDAPWRVNRLSMPVVHGIKNDPYGYRTHSSSISANSSGSSGSAGFLRPRQWASIPDGPVDLDLDIHIEVFDTSARTPPAIVTDNITLHGQFVVLPAGQGSAHVVTDPALQAAVEAALALALRKSWSLIPRLQGGMVLQGEVQLDYLPVGVAFKVYAVAADQRVDMGTLSHPGLVQNSIIHELSQGYRSKTIDLRGATTIDLVLEPDRETALGTTNMTDYWGLPIIIHNVPVTQRASSIPATPPATQPAPASSTQPAPPPATQPAVP